MCGNPPNRNKEIHPLALCRPSASPSSCVRGNALSLVQGFPSVFIFLFRSHSPVSGVPLPTAREDVDKFTANKHPPPAPSLTRPDHVDTHGAVGDDGPSDKYYDGDRRRVTRPAAGKCRWHQCWTDGRSNQYLGFVVLIRRAVFVGKQNDWTGRMFHWLVLVVDNSNARQGFVRCSSKQSIANLSFLLEDSKKMI